MRHVLAGSNIGLCTVRSIETTRGFQHAFVSRDIIQHHTVSTKEVNYIYPLYIEPELGGLALESGRRPNLSGAVFRDYCDLLDLQPLEEGAGDLESSVGPADVLHWAYAQLYSTEYRTRYAELLRRDHPRILYPKGRGPFKSLCALGANLVACHLLEADYDWAFWGDAGAPFDSGLVALDGAGNAAIAPGFPKYDDGKIHISGSSYFHDVPEEVWDYRIGGYQVCRRWLKDRSPRKGNDDYVLSVEEVGHFCRIVRSLRFTLETTCAIDTTIRESGGWQGTFVTARMEDLGDGSD